MASGQAGEAKSTCRKASSNMKRAEGFVAVQRSYMKRAGWFVSFVMPEGMRASMREGNGSGIRECKKSSGQVCVMASGQAQEAKLACKEALSDMKRASWFVSFVIQE